MVKNVWVITDWWRWWSQNQPWPRICNIMVNNVKKKRYLNVFAFLTVSRTLWRSTLKMNSSIVGSHIYFLINSLLNELYWYETNWLVRRRFTVNSEKCCSRINGMLYQKFKGRLFIRDLTQTALLRKQWTLGVLYERVDSNVFPLLAFGPLDILFTKIYKD